jgi:hypothetical protein
MKNKNETSGEASPEQQAQQGALGVASGSGIGLETPTDAELIEMLHRALQAARPFVTAAGENYTGWGHAARTALKSVDTALLTTDLTTGKFFYS